MEEKCYYVYILASRKNGTLYTGVTNDLARRVLEHKNGVNPGSFTSKYGVKTLVYYEAAYSSYSAISREKQIKAGSRKKKLDLINSFNPEWKDLFDEILK